MRTIRTKVYKFNELTSISKEKAIEHFRYINVEDEWYNEIYYDFIEEQKEKGFDVEKIYFSGFSSQGDGAMFEGKVNSLLPFMKEVDERVKKLIHANIIKIECEINHFGRYYHERTGQINVNWETLGNSTNSVNVQQEIEKIELSIRATYYDICKGLYRRLENEYCSLIDDDAVTEAIEANEYEFYQNGEFYKG